MCMSFGKRYSFKPSSSFPFRPFSHHHPDPRLLTYSYLMVFNVLLMMYPNNLSYDWQMGSIPLITSFLDTRNIMTIFVIISFIALSLVSIGTTKITSSFLLFKKKRKKKQLVLGEERKKSEYFGSSDRFPFLDNNNQEMDQKEDDDEVRKKKKTLVQLFSPIRFSFPYSVYPFMNGNLFCVPVTVTLFYPIFHSITFLFTPRTSFSQSNLHVSGSLPKVASFTWIVFSGNSFPSRF